MSFCFREQIGMLTGRLGQDGRLIQFIQPPRATSRRHAGIQIGDQMLRKFWIRCGQVQNQHGVGLTRCQR